MPRRSEEELDVVLQLGVTSLILAVRFYYEQPDQLDQIRKRYLDSLEVIKHGADFVISMKESRS